MISDELRTFDPQMSQSHNLEIHWDSLINLSTIFFSRDQAWNLQVCILLDFTNRALDIQSWWHWLELLMSVSGDQILQSINLNTFGSMGHGYRQGNMFIDFNFNVNNFSRIQTYYIVLSILSFLHRFYPIPLWHFLPKKGNQMHSVYSNLLAESILMGLHLQAGNLLCRTIHRSLGQESLHCKVLGIHLDPLRKNQ